MTFAYFVPFHFHIMVIKVIMAFEDEDDAVRARFRQLPALSSGPTPALILTPRLVLGRAGLGSWAFGSGLLVRTRALEL